MIPYNSHISLLVFEQMDPLPSATSPPRTSPTFINDKRIKPLPILGPMMASVATMFYRAPTSVLDPLAIGVVPPIIIILDTPPSPIPSNHMNLLPTVGEVVVILVAHCA